MSQIIRNRLPTLNSDRIPVCKPLLPPVESYTPYLHEIDAMRVYTNFGPLVQRLQQRFVQHLSLDGEAVLASSGTSALIGLIFAVAGRAQSEKPLCLLPAYTFVGTVVAVQQAGYTPYFIDIDPQTWQINPDHLAGLEVLDQVGLVVPVCAYGRALDSEPWEQFQKKTGTPIVIDAAAALEAIEDAPDTIIGGLPLALSLPCD